MGVTINDLVVYNEIAETFLLSLLKQETFTRFMYFVLWQCTPPLLHQVLFRKNKVEYLD
jgi:hypothetical protein